MPVITTLHILVRLLSVFSKACKMNGRQYAGGLAHCTEAIGATGVQAHSFFTLKLRSLVAVPPEKNPLVLVKQEDGRAQYPAWTLWNLEKLIATARNQKVTPPPTLPKPKFQNTYYD
jgi:hypothetical protein